MRKAHLPGSENTSSWKLCLRLLPLRTEIEEKATTTANMIMKMITATGEEHLGALLLLRVPDCELHILPDGIPGLEAPHFRI